jgi:putative ABC transport system permease protein
MNWVRRLFRKTAAEKELDRELRFHIEQRIDELTAEGLPREQAVRQTNLEFGNIEQFKEECRDARWAHHLDVVARDFRFAFRGLLKDRRFSIVAIFALALGIGSSTAIFSVIYNALIAPFPYKDQGRLVTLRVYDTDQGRYGFRGMFSYAEMKEFKAQSHSFDGFIANGETDVVYQSGDTNLFLGGNYVTPGTFELYGMRALLGRTLQPADYLPGAPPVFVLRYNAWVDYFGSNPGVIGKTFLMNGVSRTLVGIMPLRFAWGGAQLWMPYDGTKGTLMRGGFPIYWGIVAHLKPGISIAEAEADVNIIGKRIAPNFRQDYPVHFHLRVESFIHAVVTDEFRRTLYMLFGAVGLLLLIGCANVANLLLARSTMRGREFAVRTALGASRSRLIRQLLAESLILALGAAALGIFFAWVGIAALASNMPQFTVPSETVIEMNRWVLAFAIGLAVATVLVFGLAPALQASHVDVQDALRDSGKGLGSTASGVRLRGSVIVLEVALSLVLLFTASLFMRSFVALENVSLGWQPNHVFTGRLPLPPKKYQRGEGLAKFFVPLIQNLRATPGVEYASPASAVPPYGGFGGYVDVPSKTHREKWESLIQLVGEEYFAVTRQPLRAGRMFTASEANGGRKVAVINQTFQKNYFGGEDPLGRTISLDVLKDIPDKVDDPAFVVVGVAMDAPNEGLERPPRPEVWIPYSVTGTGMRRVLVRMSGSSFNVTKLLRKAVWATDPDVAIAELQPVSDSLNTFSYAQPRLGFFLVSTFAGIGLLLVSVGVYSVIAYTTSRRTHEIGIRIALGAAGSDVLKMVLRNGFLLIVPGIAVGMLASFAISRAIVSQLFGVSPYDPLTIASVVLLLLGIGLLACWVPARRATRIDPATALRCE